MLDVIPFDSFPDRVTPEIHRRILTAARDANMNMIRHWGGGYYESDDFYDICDELGIMVWQDFMFGGAMVPGDLAFQENVREEATQQVKASTRPSGDRCSGAATTKSKPAGCLGRPPGIQGNNYSAPARTRLAGLV